MQFLALMTSHRLSKPTSVHSSLFLLAFCSRNLTFLPISVVQTAAIVLKYAVTLGKHAFSAHKHQDGVYQAAQPLETPRVQICWRRQVTGLEIHTQAILYQCRHQVLPDVHGVSAVAALISPKLTCPSIDLTPYDLYPVPASVELKPPSDHPQWVQLRDNKHPHHVMV
jgi:hypothetical protein